MKIFSFLAFCAGVGATWLLHSWIPVVIGLIVAAILESFTQVPRASYKRYLVLAFLVANSAGHAMYPNATGHPSADWYLQNGRTE